MHQWSSDVEYNDSCPFVAASALEPLFIGTSDLGRVFACEWAVWCAYRRSFPFAKARMEDLKNLSKNNMLNANINNPKEVSTRVGVMESL